WRSGEDVSVDITGEIAVTPSVGMIFPVSQRTAFEVITVRSEQRDHGHIRETTIQAACLYSISSGCKSAETAGGIGYELSTIDTELESNSTRGDNNGTGQGITIGLYGRNHWCHWFLKGLRHIEVQGIGDTSVVVTGSQSMRSGFYISDSSCIGKPGAVVKTVFQITGRSCYREGS